jgi:predicted RNA binding protein YcfA (HicA-like mRNA interferase family)
MPVIGPIKRKDLIACLRVLGFEPPVYDIGRGLLVRILRQAGIERDEWEEL